MLVLVRGVPVDLPEEIAEALLLQRRAVLPSTPSLAAETRPGSFGGATLRGLAPGTGRKRRKSAGG